GTAASTVRLDDDPARRPDRVDHAGAAADVRPGRIVSRRSLLPLEHGLHSRHRSRLGRRPLLSVQPTPRTASSGRILQPRRPKIPAHGATGPVYYLGHSEALMLKHWFAAIAVAAIAIAQVAIGQQPPA